MKPTNVIVMLKLDEASRALLLKRFPKPDDSFEKEYADHVTLRYQPSKEVLESYKPFENTLFVVEVMAVAADTQIQAAIVHYSRMHLISRGNPTPHITLRSLPGVKPVTSNTMLLHTEPTWVMEKCSLNAKLVIEKLK